MTAHQYPPHIVGAVAEGINPEAFAELLGRHPDDIRYAQSRAMQRAEAALTALWEASRVDAFGDLAGLPGSAIIANRQGNTASLNDFLGIQEVGSPAHIIHWGDQA